MSYIQFMENNEIENLGKVIPIEPEVEMHDKLDSIQQELMVRFEPLKEQIKKTEDFAQKGLLIEEFNNLAKQLGINERMTIDGEMDIAA